ncbi:MAG: sulfite exporter TauE/SafE family protein [Parcubacteria group bacterium]|nr:sulfite exporter TauE/SafE family protein [Parcubacteria group bacterium]
MPIFSPIEGAVFYGGALAAEIIGTITGFGSATLFTAIAAFFMDIKTVIVVVAFFHLFGGATRLFLFRKTIDKKIILAFGVPDLAFTLIGAALIIATPSAAAQKLFGAFLVAYSLLAFFKPNFALPKKNAVLAAGGALSGFLAGLIGTGGAVRALALNAFGLPRDYYLGTGALLAVITDLARISVYFTNGAAAQTGRLTAILPIFLFIAVIGTLAGQKIVVRIKESVFHRVVLIALAAAGINFLL